MLQLVPNLTRLSLATIALTALAGCADNQSSSNNTSSTYQVRGTVSGLARGQMLTLSNNGNDFLNLYTNGPFTFNGRLTEGQAYTVMIGGHPNGQRCGATRAAGIVGGSAPVAVAISCATAHVSTVAGSGAYGGQDGPSAVAAFSSPLSVTRDDAGNLHVADLAGNRVREITPDGNVSTIAKMEGTRNIDGVRPGDITHMRRGMTVDALGNVYVSDAFGNKILRISPTGKVITLAGSGNRGKVDGAGAAAAFSRPSGIAVDAAGNIYVADSQNHSIRMIGPGGQVSTLAGSDSRGHRDGVAPQASFSFPVDLTLDAQGNLYIADSGNNRIRMIRFEPSVADAHMDE